MKRVYLLLWIFLLTCTACEHGNLQVSTASSMVLISEPIAEETVDMESEKELMEEAEMKREFCNVIEINKEYILLENVYGETYQIDSSCNNGYIDGELVVLSYKERTEIGDNVYEVNPESLFRSNSQIEIPSK